MFGPIGYTTSDDQRGYQGMPVVESGAGVGVVGVCWSIGLAVTLAVGLGLRVLA
jgi:hypothetical protein